MINTEYTDFPKSISNNTLPRSGRQTTSGQSVLQGGHILSPGYLAASVWQDVAR